jgi:hypothetical protein
MRTFWADLLFILCIVNLLTHSFTNNKCTILQLWFTLLISLYMVCLNCHHQGAYTFAAKTCSGEIVLQCLCIWDVQIIVKIYNI